ncbi:MAG: glycosyltransferase [Symploca sp. SIO2B6]|nr:glycosyltransferase [Symploca sp. SIO2B6]
MKEPAFKKNILVIAGMHRSGTSLTASLLQSAGVDIGQRLMGAGKSNLKGHFEDLDFVEFHESVFHSQGISKEGWTLNKSIQVQAQYLAQAKSILQKRSSKSTWGWKDPRATLFLNFWHDLIPDAKFLLVYRSPWEVIDSLYRRGDEVFYNNPNLAVDIWVSYNQAIIDFYDKFSEKCAILDIKQIALNPKKLIETVTNKLDIPINSVTSLYDKNLLNDQISSSHRPTLIKHYFTEAFDLYQELNSRAQQNDSVLLSLDSEPVELSSYKAWVLQDWLEVRILEGDLKFSQSQLQQTQSALEQSQSQLQQAQSALERSPSQLQQTQSELEYYQSQLQQTQSELEYYQSQLRQTQSELEYSQSELQQAQSALEHSQSELQQAQSALEHSQSQLQQTQSTLERSQFQRQQIQSALEHSQSQLQQTQSTLEHSQFQRQQTQSALEHSQSQLQQTQSALEHSQSQLQQTQSALERSQSQLQQTQSTLERSQSQLQQTQSALERSQSQLQQTQSALERSQSQLQQTQSALECSQFQRQQTQSELERSQVVIAAMESSKFWQLRSFWFKFRSILGLAEDISLEPSNLWSLVNYLFTVLRVKGLRYSLSKLFKIFYQKSNTPTLPLEILPEIPHSDDVNYQKWLLKNYPNKAELTKLVQTIESFSYKPVISLIVPVFNTPESFLRQAIDSVLNQVYPYWELCIADDSSTEPYIRSILEDYVSKDPRIKVVFRTENGHISSASNSAIEIATGEFIGLLDHDDLLTPDALYQVALLLNQHPEADMIYSDEDKVDEHNKLRDPFFKPDWCPDSFLSRMYTCHLGIYRRSIVNLIGGFRVGYEGSQDYDLVLRFTEKTEKIFHIPKILYHWRMHANSTASSLDSKNYAVEAAKKALSEAIQRRGEPGIVTAAPDSTDYHIIRYDIKSHDLVSIIIPTKNLGNVLDNCLHSLFEKTIYENYEIILIDNGSTEPKAIEVISKWKTQEPDRFRCYYLDIPFNYSKLNNFAVKQAKGKYLLFLNNDTEVITADWINAMLEQAQRPLIGAVGALLLYPDNTIQHAGVIAGIGGVAGHSHKYFKASSQGYFSYIKTVNNFSAVTAACLMCRRNIYEEVGGFEEKLSVAFNDVDFCFKLVEKGYRNIYLPHVVLYHYESKSRGSDNSPSKLSRFIKEIEYMQNKWKAIIANDPCYNPHLSRKIENYSIEI